MEEDLNDLPLGLAEAEALLPAWFVGRMMCDVWYFGLLLTTGMVLGITTISGVKQDASGALWIDVELADPLESFNCLSGNWDSGIKFLRAPTSRCTASIAVAHIVAAVELADT